MIQVLSFALVVCLTVADECPYRPTPTESFPYSQELTTDKSYFVFWKFNTSHITFEVHAKTHGYVGFGLSSNGRMYPADIVIGWVNDDESVHFSDFHSDGHFLPTVDKSQDWKLLRAEENEFGTVLKFIRKLETCDPDDYAITDDTVRVIYAFHPLDPESEDSIPYHGGGQRGSKSILLLDGAKAHIPLPSNLKTFDFVNGNYTIPAKGTTYHCTTFQFPDIGGKHHVVKYSPVTTPGNSLFVHHIVVYHCKGIDPKYDGMSYECYSDPVSYRPACRTVFLMWEIGANDFTWPDDTGLSIGAPEDPSFFIMETHYDNPNSQAGVVDNSGIRIYFTSELRRLEAGVMETGTEISLLQFIPPHMKSFPSEGICSQKCLQLGLPNVTDEIKVFAVFQHSHLLAKGMKTRLIRNGVELEPIANDQNYDFNFQEARRLKKEITIKSDDSLIVECNFDSTDRTRPTLGGLATHDEMCLSFLMYYPRVPLDACLSVPYYNAPSEFKIDRLTETLKETDHHFPEQMRHLNGLIDSIDWKDENVRDTFWQKLQNSQYQHHCYVDGIRVLDDTFDRPEITKPFQKPPSNCNMTEPVVL